MPWGNMIVTGYITGLMNITFQNFSNGLYHPQIEQLIVYSDICGSILQIINFALLPMPFKQYLYSALQYLSFSQISSRKWSIKGLPTVSFLFKGFCWSLAASHTIHCWLLAQTLTYLMLSFSKEWYCNSLEAFLSFLTLEPFVWIWWQQFLTGDQSHFF